MSADEKWFKAIYDEHQENLHQLAMRMTDDMSIAQKIVSDVMVRTWESRDRLRKTDIKGYLLISVKNACIDHFRQVKRSRIDYSDMADLQQMTIEEDVQVVSVELRMFLHDIISQLPGKQREVICKLFLEGKHKQQVAAEMQISVNTVEEHYYRGIKRMRELIEKNNLKKYFDL